MKKLKKVIQKWEKKFYSDITGSKTEGYVSSKKTMKLLNKMVN